MVVYVLLVEFSCCVVSVERIYDVLFIGILDDVTFNVGVV